MLHAEDNWAFSAACQEGHQETAEWLMGLCQTAEEKVAMLHAKDNWAFGAACNGKVIKRQQNG